MTSDCPYYKRRCDHPNGDGICNVPYELRKERACLVYLDRTKLNKK